MADVIYDVVKGLRDFFQASLPVNAVKVSYRDERSEGESTRDYPEATLTLLPSEFDNKRRTGLIKDVVKKPLEDPPIAEVRNAPIPVNLHFQLDTYAKKKTEDWNIAEVCFQIFGVRWTKVITEGLVELFIYPMTNDTLDNLSGDSIFRKNYRFYTQIWFDSLGAAEEVYLILEHQLEMNNQLMTLNEVP